MARQNRLNTGHSLTNEPTPAPVEEKAEEKPLDQTVFPLPQECQPDPVFGWEGREPFRFDAE